MRIVVSSRTAATSADALPVRRALTTHPSSRIRVPLMAVIRDGADRRLERLPALLIVQRTLHRLRDEPAPSASPDPLVEAADDLLIQRDVHSHSHKLVSRVRT